MEDGAGQNGKGKMPVPPAAAPGLIGTSWQLERLADGRKRFHVYAIHVPVASAPMDITRLGPNGAQPRLAGFPVVLGEALLEAPNLEVAKALAAGIGEMLAKQPPEIVIPR